MRHAHSLLWIILSLLVLTGCPGPKPWQGITPQAFASLNEHRFLGIAMLENQNFPLPGGTAREAAAEFQAIQKAQPGLGFGYVNEAAAQLQIQGPTAADAQAAQKTALKAAQRGVELLPGAAWPQLVLAHAYQAAGQNEKAGNAFRAAMNAEPNNIRMVGELARHLENSPGDHTAELYDLYRRAVEASPDNLVAQLKWMGAQAERKEQAGALATLERVSQLVARVPAPAQESYARARQALGAGEAGAPPLVRQFGNMLVQTARYRADYERLYGNPNDGANLVMRDWGTPPPPMAGPQPRPVSITWKDVTLEAGLDTILVIGIAPAAVGDVNLFPQAGQASGEEVRIQERADLALAPGPEGVLLNEGTRFTGKLGGTPAAGSPLLADLNNDFSLDLYVSTPAGNRLWTNPRKAEPGMPTATAPGMAFKPAAPVPGKGPGVPLAVDLDQDGDLDVIQPSSSPDQPAVRYLRNNGNMTFTDLTLPAGLNLPSQGARQVAFGDFDGEGAPDLFLVRSDAACQLFLNQRQDLFRNRTVDWGIRLDRGARAAAVADFDRDGDWDLAAAGARPHGSVLYRNEGGKFVPDEAILQPLGGAETEWVQFLDYDNDTWLDLVFAGPSGIRLLHNERGKFADGGAALADPAVWVKAFDYDQDGDVDLLAQTEAGKLRLLSNEGGNARPWMSVELQGVLRNLNQQNNSFGIGTQIQARTPWDQQSLLVTDPITHVGLGAAERAGVLRTLWTHGVPQNKIPPPLSGTVHFAQAPGGSCPFLYTWDGEAWRFACDFNWRSPLGMLRARGAPVPHDQTRDWVKLSGEQMKAIGSYYGLIATEELREISYFDMIRLLAVDHPEGTEVYVDERFPFGPPDPFRIYTVRHPFLPASARNEKGEDLLPLLKARDNRYTPVPSGPYRGVLAPHDLVLDLGKVPDPARVRLFLNGWIYPAANSTNIAASQNPDLRLIPPTLYVGDGRGGWKEIDRTVGMPCGKRKTMVLDLGGNFVGRDYRVRLTTTMEIRWDHAFFTSGEEDAPVRQAELPLAEAELRERGYGARYREVEDGPDLYDYNRPLPAGEPGWPDIAGAYTRLGDCAPLLKEVDDRYAIVAPGDEIRLYFDARSTPGPPPGWKRDFVLMSDGWTKDTDRNTVTGESVEPLPFHGMKRYPYGPEERFPDDATHQAWRREWNTRVKGRARP